MTDFAVLSIPERHICGLSITSLVSAARMAPIVEPLQPARLRRQRGQIGAFERVASLVALVAAHEFRVDSLATTTTAPASD